MILRLCASILPIAFKIQALFILTDPYLPDLPNTLLRSQNYLEQPFENILLLIGYKQIDLEGQTTELKTEERETQVHFVAHFVAIFHEASLFFIKFGYSEKATKFEKIFHLRFDATQ